MSADERDGSWRPEWLTPDEVDTVIVAFPDVYGRLLGKRMTLEHFLEHTMSAGMFACNYILTIDIDMNPLPGFKLASWDQGYGDFHIRLDVRSLRLLPWHKKTAIVLADVLHADGSPVEESPRRVLARQVEKVAEKGLVSCMGSELEFFLFHGRHAEAGEKGPGDLRPASAYLIDYHILQPGRDEEVMRRLRNEMTAARIKVECTKGEWGRGQHELNLAYAEALEMADRHILFKLGAKEIADQHGRAVTFMAKWNAAEAGSSFHIHSSLWDGERKRNLFADREKESTLFRQFLGGLMKYTRELCTFFAPTVNSYKRYQHSSWAPTRIVWGYDNRTCGFRIVGKGESLRIENRMPGADGNPYLAFAATLAAGMRGVEEGLDCGEGYKGNAYEDEALPQLPESLGEAAALLEKSDLAREAFGTGVVEFYAHTARLEAQAFGAAVTDWERGRYFEQI